MNSELLKNILAQGESLRIVAEQFAGSGREELVRGAELLKRAPRIIVTGMGASLFASMPFPYLIGGQQANAIESAELLHFLKDHITPQTALIVVSRSGESVEVVKLLELACERGAVTVGVSNLPQSTLLRNSTAGILLHSPADQLVAVQTYTVTAVVLALLAAACIDKLDEAIADLHNLTSILPAWIDECFTASQGWSELIEAGPPLYLLGRGAAMGSVCEGVLLMHEVAKTPAAGMSIPQFRHGPVEAVDKSFRAIVIGTQRSTVSLDRHFANDLANMGAAIAWLGPAAGDGPFVPMCRWPASVTERFHPVLETIPLQLLAYRTVERRGIEAVPFRWAPTVTASETGFLSHA